MRAGAWDSRLRLDSPALGWRLNRSSSLEYIQESMYFPFSPFSPVSSTSPQTAQHKIYVLVPCSNEKNCAKFISYCIMFGWEGFNISYFKSLNYPKSSSKTDVPE